MKFTRILLIAFLFLAGQMTLLAQDNCYETARKKGIQLYNQGKYSTAYKTFEAAKWCTDVPANNDLDSWMEKCDIHVKFTPKSLLFEAIDAEEQCVEVSTNAKVFKVGDLPSWVSVTVQGKMLYVSCEDNNTLNSREAKIAVTAGGKTGYLDVIQGSADLEFSLEPDRLVFSSGEETRAIRVITNATDWQVAELPQWVSAMSIRDTILVSTQKNPTPYNRETEMNVLVDGLTYPVKIRQMPGDTILSVAPTELLLPSNPSSACFGVSCSVDTWRADSPEDWIQLSRIQDSVVVVVAENHSLFSRHGLVTVTSGKRSADMVVHQRPHVSAFEMPVSELGDVKAGEAGGEVITVSSIPSELVVYVDDSIAKTTPFDLAIDYQHHSILMGFERRDCLFNEKQENIVFKPGLRFAHLTFGKKSFGMRAGFVGANDFGAYQHFMATNPVVVDFNESSSVTGGYHYLIGPVYRPIPYAGIYAGVGAGIFNGSMDSGLPTFAFDYEAGVMGFFKNASVSLGFRSSRWDGQGETSFVFGIGGYLKRYYGGKDLGYCSSDSRRWWSLNYVARPALNGQGVMFGDIGKGLTRAYIKALYFEPLASSLVGNVEMDLGLMFCPVNGIIDFCLGAGANVNPNSLSNLDETKFEAEAGVVLNVWRFPITVMFHRSDLFGAGGRLYADLGIGFHFGEFRKSSYK